VKALRQSYHTLLLPEQSSSNHGLNQPTPYQNQYANEYGMIDEVLIKK
jgi:hypothetical protein